MCFLRVTPRHLPKGPTAWCHPPDVTCLPPGSLYSTCSTGLRDSFPVTQFGNRLLPMQVFQHNADFLLGAVLPSRLAGDCLDGFFSGYFLAQLLLLYTLQWVENLLYFSPSACPSGNNTEQSGNM